MRDLGEAFELNLDQREYDARPYPPKPLAKEELAKWGLRPAEVAPPSAATLRIEITTVDTGERKDFFGHAARRVVTTRKETPLEGSHSGAQESVTDGWYIDLDTRISCDLKWPANKKGFARLTIGNAAPERIEFVQTGDAETGFPVEWKATSKSEFALPDGTKSKTTSKNDMRIVEFVEGPPDPALFEVPAGFKKVALIDGLQSARRWVERDKDCLAAAGGQGGRLFQLTILAGANYFLFSAKRRNTLWP